MENRDKQGQFVEGHIGLKPKGAKDKRIEFRRMLFDSFFRNEEKAIKRIDEMYDKHGDFKWLAQLLASMLPRELKGEGFENRNITMIWRIGNSDGSYRDIIRPTPEAR